jgi:hypothetical protein
VRLGKEVLSEAHYCAAVGDRPLEIVFKQKYVVFIDVTALATYLEAVADGYNDAVHFFICVGQKSMQHLSTLRPYGLSPGKLKKESTYDSSALLSAKVWIVREFVKQGLPEVRVFISPPSHAAPSILDHHTPPHAHHPRQSTHAAHVPTCRISERTSMAESKSTSSTSWRTS